MPEKQDVPTKEAILKAALELFNSRGVLQTSTRDIADACSISQGNLTYHFPKKSDIITSLFLRLKEKNDAILKILTESEFNQDLFRKGILMQFRTMFESRFLFLDFLNILREIEPLRKKYAELESQRRNDFFKMFEILVKNDLIKKRITNEDLESIYRVFSIYFNFWISDAEIRSQCSAETVPEYERGILQILLSLLNKKGRDIFSGELA